MIDSSHVVGSSDVEQALVVAAAREAADLAPQLARLRCESGISETRTELPSGLFADYEVVCELDRGGQGVVYQAIHKRSRRSMAIKVMREGPFAGPRDRARFEREVEILRQIDHPNVVSIRDHGVAAGCHYLVTDYIEGTPLDQWISEFGLRISDSNDRNKRPTAIRKLLALFKLIGDAVNAAHLLGVIHRDLKPSNILIDAAGQPHILDFGLAKMAIGEGWDDRRSNSDAHWAVRHVTVTGQFVGSLPWSAPEQAAGLSREVDTRTDVYALGVILYRSATGQFPYAVNGPMHDVVNAIAKVPPARPRALCAGMDDEVETILLKCLAKERERRYQTAGELARDIERYLQGEPIEAKRESGWYMFKKVVHRYRAAACASASLVVVIAAAAAALLAMYTMATRQRMRAELERDRAMQAEERALHERARAEQISTYIQNMLGSADPAEARGREVAVRDVLDQASHQLESQLASQPEVQAEVRMTLAKTYANLGQYEQAKAHLQAALDEQRKQHGDEHAEVARVQAQLGEVLQRMGDLAQAEALLRQALATRRKLLGQDHPDVAANLASIAALASNTGRLAEAELIYREVLATRRRTLGSEHSDVATTMAELGALLFEQGKVAEAELLLRDALVQRRRVLGDKHPDVAATMNSMGKLLLQKGDAAGAEALLRQALADGRETLAANDPRVVQALSSLGECLTALGRFAEAEAILLESLETARTVLGEQHPQIAAARRRLAKLYEAWGRPEEAARYENADVEP